jgi:protein-tyrosine-phosphatase
MYDLRMATDLERRALAHAALGDPVRLAIVDDLTTSDRSPTELAKQFGLASNLLAHHLDVLTRAGVIERVASGGDRRRKYVRLRPDAFDQIGRRPRRPGSMMFVCTGNSARSQLAAALWTSRTGSTASSAGTRPASRVHPGAVAAAGRVGLDISDAVPRALSAVDPAAELSEVQLVTVCDQAHEELEPPNTVWHWSIPDPVRDGSDAAFDATVRDIEQRIATVTHSGGEHDD